MKVLWITNIPSPYRLKFFSELGKKVNLTVLFEKGYSSERNDVWKDYSFENYDGVVLKGISVLTDMALAVGYRKYIKKHKNDIIVVSNPATPTGISAILYMQLHHIKYCIESDGAFPQENKGIKGVLKTLLYSHSDYCFTTSEMGMQYFVNYHVKENRIRTYPFSSVMNKDILDYSEKDSKIESTRKELHIQEEKMLLSVGRFIPEKGFENLIQSYNLLPGDVGVYIVGGTPTAEYLSLISENKKNKIHFLDFMPSELLQKYYLCADVFVFPTHKDVWGLVVNEAMAAGLPVITTDKCISGLEMIRNGSNGYIVKDNDINELTERINELLGHKELKQFCLNSLDRASEYTIETMVDAHISYFKEM